jgi:DNA-binding NarL/FixJ family response regulator
VAKWTHQHLDAASFSAWQAAQGAKKGKAQRDALLPQVAAMAQRGASQREIARTLGLTQRTVGNWLRR